MSLIDNAPRTATIKALEDCTVLQITSEDFSRRIERADPVMQMVIQVILTRYRDTLTRADISRTSSNWPPVEVVELSHAQKSDALQNIKVASAFKEALENGEIELHYQPIIDLQHKTIAGFEALMRWTHPEQGPISPAVFIPVAEENGLIVDATKFALAESCAALKRLQDQVKAKENLFMSVNFSSRDFSEDGFIENDLSIF